MDTQVADVELVFVPGDPPRTGVFIAYDLFDPGTAPDGSTVGGLPRIETVLVLPAGSVLRRRAVAARVLTVETALRLLLPLAGADGSAGSGATASASVWATVLLAVLGIVARGRLHPSVSAGGSDAWLAGPLADHDVALLDGLAGALPASGYCVPTSAKGPLRLRSAAALVRACADAVADTLPRVASAPLVTGGALYAVADPQPAEHLRPWVTGALGSIRRTDDAGDGGWEGADVALRVELDDADGARAVVQLSSRADPSLVMDAEDLWTAPPFLRARFGPGAEADLLRALRRGARAWAPLQRLLTERVPHALVLEDDEVQELLTSDPGVLEGTGMEVLWPAGLVSDGLSLRASVVPQPGVVTASGFGLDMLLQLRWQAAMGDEVLTDQELDQLAEAKRGVVRLRGRWVVVRPELLERLAARGRRVQGAEALGLVLGGRVVLDGEEVPVVAEGALGVLRDRLVGSGPDHGSDLAVPEGLRAELRPYQRRGLTWLAEMVDLGLGGCLADDMGLGKTLQVIALHAHLHERGSAVDDGTPGRDPARPTLVVCPTSLLGNWEREVHRFAPGVEVRRFHGAGRELDALDPAAIVLTTYGVVRRDHHRLAATPWGLVVADEAQAIKNPHAAGAKAIRAIPAPARVALTGTPVENRLSELWSILDWTTPGLLGPLDRFVSTVAVPVERFRDAEATERLGRMVRPFLLRRRKTDPDIAPDLPPRTVTDQPVPLTTEQATLYAAEVKEALDAIGDRDGIARQGLVLRMLTVLKQICNHPAHYLHQTGPLPGRSGKLAAFEELVEVILSEGDAMLVFTQFVECGRLLEARLGELGVHSAFLHGGVGVRKRQEMVDRFQAGEVPVFLLSLKAGGVGLNLTQATHVVHFDRWWNPAVEDQATDRAHRIGQDRPVQVHRLIAEGTLEDRIAALLDSKRQLAESVIGGGEGWIADLSDAELAELVRLGADR